jgi:hypothetical protein
VTEIQRYEVLSNQDGFETRRYEPFVTISKIENGSMAAAGNQAFRPLANFIFGGNKSGQQIAMTAPVTQVKVADGYRVSFVMPASMRIENMPEPASSDILIEEHPAGKYAALKFSGLATEKLFQRKEALLRKKLEQDGIGASPMATYARYNGPWTPGPLRRNEVLIPLL